MMRKGSSSDGQKVSLTQSTGEIRTGHGRADPDLHIETFADDSVGIRAGERYVGADQIGGVRNDVTWCREWERYRLVRADTFDTLPLLRRYSWLSHSDRRIVSLADQPIDFGREQPAEASALVGSRCGQTKCASG